MKQHITKEQWDELNKKEQKYLLKFCYGESVKRKNFEYCFDVYANIGYKLSIGQMIEFLGDDWYYSRFITNPHYRCTLSKNRTLCDDLWEAVKYKIKK